MLLNAPFGLNCQTRAVSYLTTMSESGLYLTSCPRKVPRRVERISVCEFIPVTFEKIKSMTELRNLNAHHSVWLICYACKFTSSLKI
jgi:hypothetical protein